MKLHKLFMKNTLSQTYKELTIPYFNEVFTIIDGTLLQLQIPYYLIGVTAVALELLKEGIKPSRGTKDIDFAIMISSLSQFENVIQQLECKGFNKVKAPWTFYHPAYNVVVDILPFGQIEEKDTANFTDRKTDLHVLGLKEVLEEGVPVAIEEKFVHIPPLHGMIILKLISWNDRPEDRDNYLKDILFIISKYFDINANEIYNNHNDVFTRAFNKSLIAARVLGRKAGAILKKSDKVRDRVLLVLENNINNKERSAIAERWAADDGSTVEEGINILKELKSGIKETLQ